MSLSDQIAKTTLLWTIVGVIVAVAACVTPWGQLLWSKIQQWKARRRKTEEPVMQVEKPRERQAPYVSVCRTYFDLDYAYNQLYPERRRNVVVRQEDGKLFLDHVGHQNAQRRNRLL